MKFFECCQIIFDLDKVLCIRSHHHIVNKDLRHLVIIRFNDPRLESEEIVFDDLDDYKGFFASLAESLDEYQMGAPFEDG